METPSRISIDALIDTQSIGGYRLAVFALAVMLAMLDGIDNVTLGLAAPALSAELGIARSELASVFTATLVGLTVGAFALGYAGDRWGRRPCTIACVALFGAFTLAVPFAQDINHLIVFRALAGVGIGGLLPNICALVAEFAPSRHRQTGVLVVSGGIAAGAMLGGVLSAMLEPAFGWRALFFVAGGATLVALIATWLGLPESVRFLLARRGDEERVAALLRRIAPQAPLPPDARFTMADLGGRVSLGRLFGDGLAATTILLWVSYATVLAVMYLLFQWLPTLARDFGFSQQQAIFAATAFNLGGMLGSVLLGPLAARWGTYRVATVNFLLIAPFVFAIAHSSGSSTLLLSGAFAAGWTVMGGLGLVNALAAESYPTAVRATGIGWASGIGRLGSAFSPSLIGLLLAAGWTARDVLELPIAPAVVMALAVIGIGRMRRKRLPAAAAGFAAA
ncbi:MFS transporter (plasmid) [Bosea sp. F3-2]|uniref:MFS transporter n=1 Tax=Bosea sp. F3-2 TaxID=2599640 RepID=UPI0011EE1ED2|nr:MFS transporter [Bosea sp. F3-2]QEL27017.1 MFS transporter [Bosea sp. F3-2]